MTRPRPFDAGEFPRVAKKLAEERTAAAPVVRQLRTALDAYWDRQIPRAWRTVGFVQELTAAARDTLKHDPKATLALAQFAVVIAGSLPAEAYPQAILTQAEAAAWKEIANAHRYRSEYAAALRALDVVDGRLARVHGLGHDRATLRLTRALVLTDQGQGDEALALLRECVTDFTEYDDGQRIAQCLHLRGMIEQRAGRFHEAITTYESALEYLEDVDDRYVRASLQNNMGHVYAELQQPDEALACLREALALFDDLHATGEVARTAWGLGRVLLANERYTEAKSAFVGARRSLLRLMLPEEAGLAGLDLADAFLATGAVAAAVRQVEEVIDEFRAANLNGRALMALQYLSDLLPTPRARAAVRHVRTYIDELRRSPNLLFLELPES
jgi:tetratricopeptide (TPR) repeat protein